MSSTFVVTTIVPRLGHKAPWQNIFFVVLLTNLAIRTSSALLQIPPPATSRPAWTYSVAHAWEHLMSSDPTKTLFQSAAPPLEDITNTRIPGPPGSGIEILSYVAKPSSLLNDDDDDNNNNKLPVLIMIHEFFGLNPSIIEKAKYLADDLNCFVIAPDTFRGAVTNFIPKAIWLALSTPSDRVNDDLDAICRYLEGRTAADTSDGINDDEIVLADTNNLAVMGFCYGGGKAIQYTTQRRTSAATVIFYGQPIVDVEKLQSLKAPVCGIYGREDIQFPMPLIEDFQKAILENPKISAASNIRVYDGVGHAFWSNIDQIKQGDQPQTDAYKQCTEFLRTFFATKK